MPKDNWKTVPIETIYIGFYDGPHATPKPAQKGPIFLGIKNITEDGRLDLSEIRHIAEEDFSEWTRRIKPSPGDIIFTYEATLNRYAIIPEGFRGCLGRRLALIRPNTKRIDTKYLFYYFFSQEWRNTINTNIIPGSTVDRIPLISFPNFPLTLPPLPIQHTIANILSSYDDLIENNTRRITILEQMAQMLYQEWFVKFRFPGHEQVEMVESELEMIPKGWDMVPFITIADILSGGTPKTTVPEYWDGEIPFYTPKDAPSSFFVTETEKSITELGLSTCSSKLYPKNTVFITARGTVGKVTLNAVPMAMNQSCYALQGRDTISQFFVFMHIKNFIRHLKQTANGAVFDTIIVDTFKQLEVAQPPLELINKFTTTVLPIFEQILNLTQKNMILRQTRDMLLPKLISGEMDVSAWAGEEVEEVAEMLGQEHEVTEPVVRKVAETGMVTPLEKDGLEQPSLWG